jgi:hypothetical protein
MMQQLSHYGWKGYAEEARRLKELLAHAAVPSKNTLLEHSP